MNYKLKSFITGEYVKLGKKENKMETYTQNKLNQNMIGLGNAQEIMRVESEKIAAFAAKFVANAMAQLHYDVLTNLPTGVLNSEQIKGNALKHGIVTAISNLNGYGITEQIEIAADLLEDVNAHKEAAELRKQAYEVA